VQVKIRRSDFRTVTRQRSLRPPDNGTDQLFAIARDLLAIWLARNPGQRIRLLGVGGTNLAPAEQRDLFSDDDASSSTAVDRTVDEIRDRFGNASVSRARILDRP
jgi:DNA polymerase-4